MNTEELRAEMGRKNISIPKLAKAVKISKKAMYSRIYGETEFKRDEITAIQNELELSDERLIQIFFAKEVS